VTRYNCGMIATTLDAYARRSYLAALLVALVVLQGTAWPVPSLAQSAVSSRWATAMLSQPRAGLAGVVVGSKALFAGGESDAVDIYDSASGRWATAMLSEARMQAAAVTVGTQAVFAGGVDGVAQHGLPTTLDTVDIYDDRTGRWSTASLSQPRGINIAAVSVGTRAVLAGGTSISLSPYSLTPSSVVDIYERGQE
jgi:hypothetical protein